MLLKHPCYCGSPGYAKKLCRYHYFLQWPLKRTALKSKPVKINPVSKSRAKALREYEKEKAEFFKTVTVCQYPGCQSEDLDLHHKRGRVGNLLTDRSNFAGLCRKHHIEIEENPLLAYRLGLSGERLKK